MESKNTIIKKSNTYIFLLRAALNVTKKGEKVIWNTSFIENIFIYNKIIFYSTTYAYVMLCKKKTLK